MATVNRDESRLADIDERLVTEELAERARELDYLGERSVVLEAGLGSPFEWRWLCQTTRAHGDRASCH